MATSTGIITMDARTDGAALAFSRPSHLPDFTRIAWVSDEARSTWGPRINRILLAWGEIERLSVLERLRSCALISVDPVEMVALAGWATRAGLILLPLARQAAGPGSYSAVTQAADASEPFAYRAVLGRLRDVRRFEAAWARQDDSAMGALLGFPSCCRAFFERVWKDLGRIDTTWEMTLGSGTTVVEGPGRLLAEGPATSNILLRWLGVRAVPHLPCGFDCGESATLGDAMLSLMARTGYVDEAGWIREALDWPVEWSARNGMAEIKTPILKIATRTDVSSQPLVVRREGTGYPEQGASGTRFPFRRLKAFQRRQPAEPAWAANGFASEEAMTQAHAPIVDHARRLLAATAMPRAVLDLGCGDGALLAKIGAGGGVSLYGVEIDRGRAAASHRRCSATGGRCWADDLGAEDAEWASMRFSLVLLMPGRLLERSAENRAVLRSRLAGAAHTLLVYAYPDTLAAAGCDLGDLTVRAGLGLVSMSPDGFTAVATAK